MSATAQQVLEQVTRATNDWEQAAANRVESWRKAREAGVSDRAIALAARVGYATISNQLGCRS